MLTPPPSQLWGPTVVLTLGSSHVVVGVQLSPLSLTTCDVSPHHRRHKVVQVFHSLRVCVNKRPLIRAATFPITVHVPSRLPARHETDKRPVCRSPSPCRVSSPSWKGQRNIPGKVPISSGPTANVTPPPRPTGQRVSVCVLFTWGRGGAVVMLLFACILWLLSLEQTSMFEFEINKVRSVVTHKQWQGLKK